MKKLLCLLILGSILCTCRPRSQVVAEPAERVQAEFAGSGTTAKSLKVMSYNIRLNTPQDGENAWPRRREFLANQILFHAPLAFGIQEGLPDQVTWLDERLTEYGFIGQGRRGLQEGEFSAIYYHRTSLQLIESGTFWLSETPDRVSTGWDAALPRICTWARFKHLGNKQEFMMFNTHFDHVGTEARQKSAALILRKTKALNPNQLPVTLTGDLNLTPETVPIQSFATALKDTYDTALIHLGPTGTFSGFHYNYAERPERRIDYVFVSPDWEVTKYAVLTDAVAGRFASDHFPVIVELLFPTTH
ncbi:MAG: endonuclease/exonuclease/phosphatase family protein [Bacteroidota bacterium]